MNTKSVLIICAISFQVLAVAGIAISKEIVLKTGRQITLQTAPIDPRDIFKGDYVTLDYNFSSIPVYKLDSKIKQYGARKGQKIYLTMTEDEYGLGQAGELLLEPPENTFYLTGYVKQAWPYRGFNKMSEDEKKKRSDTHPVKVKFGIEQYYVEQGKGKEMEKIRGNRNSFQRPMLVNIAVSNSGNALIHSVDWANIAMKTEILKSPQSDAPDDQASAIMRFTLKNKSNQPISLPLKNNGCSFKLIPTSRNPQRPDDPIFNRTECNGLETPLTTLKIDETVSVDFDLNQPQWIVEYKNKPTVMGKLPWEYRYRIVYDGKSVPGINANIMSSAFHGRGNID